MILYSNGCPMCIQAKTMLDEKCIEYTLEDNMDKIIETASALGISSMPILVDEHGQWCGAYALQHIKEI